MKTKYFLLIILLFGVSISCEKNKNESNFYTFSGKAQKGPFITGTILTLNELNSNLSQTGKSFTTTITYDDGSFELSNIELNSSLALLTANGFYFNEIYGELSSANLSLQAITDLNEKEKVNINILTHLIKGRIENLVSNGKTFQEANEQAKSELLTFLGITDSFDKDFEDLDISEENEYNGILLAFSIILQRYTMFINEKPLLVAELTQLLTNINIDLKEDGIINNQELIDTLLYNISQLNLIDIRNSIETKYFNLDQSISIPNFEKYIAIFQEKFSSHLYTSFYYPDSASPDPVTAPEAVLPNLLVPSDTIFQATMPYSIAAIIPLNSSLSIKFIGNNYLTGDIHGWELINDFPNGFTLNSQRQNELMTMLFYLESSGTATIEYYENNSEIAVFTKRIKW